jgi:glutamine cyclotransferase
MLNRRRFWWTSAAAAGGAATAVWAINRSRLPKAAGYEVLRTFPHDPQAFCQGLTWADGHLYESTGRYGRSSLRKVDLDTGNILQQVKLKDDYFGEGLMAWEDSLIQLTWQNGVAIIYGRENLAFRSSFPIPCDGWGLTHDGRRWFLSDGTSTLRILDPKTRQVVDWLKVKDGDRPVPRINELEFVEGEIYANIWQSDRIVRISPESGNVLGWIDLTGLMPQPPFDMTDDTVNVLNGIAYDPEQRRLWVTGKNWPKLFEIRIAN